MKLQYSLSFDDYATAQALHSRRSAIRFLSHVAGYYVFPIIGVCFLAFAFLSAKSTRISWLAVSSGAYLLFCPLILRLAANSRYKRMRSGSGECAIEFQSTMIRTLGAHSKSEIEWAAIQFFSENKKVFLLYLAPGKFIVIPKRVCSVEQVSELHSLLLTKTNPESALIENIV